MTAARAGAARPSLGITCSGNFFGFDVLRAVEDLGFDAFYTGEHFIYDKGIQDALPVLGAAVGATSRIAIGSAAFIAPLYPPILLAKACSSLDVLSGGRLIAGIGVGGEFPAEFEAFGIPTAKRGARCDEVIDLLRAFWSGDAVAYHGEFYDLDVPGIEPPPVQQGGPPIWVTGRSNPAMRRAALRGDGFMPYLVSADSYGQRVAFITSEAAKAGRELPGDYAWGVRIEMCVADDDQTANQRVTDALSWRFGKPFAPAQAERYSIAGTA
ncbi:MAG: LLM class flavin-dependent oxidoreductase, partial [Solirubrobacterales bacterium]